MNNILTPIKIKNILIQNRIVLPPLVRFSMIEDDGYVTDKLLDWYESIARDGVGMIIVEATCVSADGKLRENQLGIWDDSFIEGLSKIAKIGKKYKIPMLIQIHHAGFGKNIKDVDEKILDEILDKFVIAFHRAKKAGFDGIEIHGAHTYLLSQLNSRLWNTRNDKYGGDFERRMYFNKTLIERTRELFDDNFILGYRLGGNEPTLEDSTKIAIYLQDLGLDLIHISSGIPEERFRQPAKIDNFPENYPEEKDFKLDWVIYMGVEIKKHLHIPVIGVRNIRTEEQVSYLIENNLLDMVAVGRAMIFTNKWMVKTRKAYLKRVKNDTK
ncbi:NADH:flavin oxidoreductase [Fusobacterium sp.]|uniref:NADH:flavin oxidoreductase n=1 Tax=Fusobacterium sp. TaxID=68766 RepID=UPI00260D8568|nr:NADH:flavin oxidoreductase [Fusobacterium sp.]